MNLSDLECYPGRVVNANDEQCLGRVQCAVPNVFDTRNTPVDELPWVYPFSMGGYQKFSKMAEGASVWVLHDKTAHESWWYLPGFEKNDDLAEIVSKNENSEVLFARLDGSAPAAIYYDDVDGINQKIGDSNINLKTNGDLDINSNDTNINASGGEISIGNKGQETQCAALGNGVYEALQEILNGFQAIADANDDAGLICAAARTALSPLQKKVTTDKIQSKAVKIN